MTLYIQICCLLAASRHINGSSSGAPSDIGANELRVSDRGDKTEEGEVEIAFPVLQLFKKVL